MRGILVAGMAAVILAHGHSSPLTRTARASSHGEQQEEKFMARAGEEADGDAEIAQTDKNVPWWKQHRPRVFTPDPPPEPEAKPVEPVKDPEPEPEPEPPKKVVFVPKTPKVMEWGQDYRTWAPVSGYLNSHSHGDRIVRTYAHPREAAEIFRQNARNIRLRNFEHLRPYPQGTIIVQESWSRTEMIGPGRMGPLFYMRKEEPGYDPANGDWQYVLANRDFNIIGSGRSSQVEFCKKCHSTVSAQDYIFATQH